MTDIDMDELVPNPFPTIESDNDVRVFMDHLNQALLTAETALYKADTLVAVLNSTDDYRDQWLTWQKGRNLRLRVQQAIDAVVTSQAMHAPYPTADTKLLPDTVWYFANDEDETSEVVYPNLVVAQNAAAEAFATEDPDLEPVDPAELSWRHHTFPDSGREVWLLDHQGTYTGWSVNPMGVAGSGAKAGAR